MGIIIALFIVFIFAVFQMGGHIISAFELMGGMIVVGFLFAMFTSKSNNNIKRPNVPTWGKPVYDPKMFEAQVANMFRKYGYRVQETPYQGDHGIDLKIMKEDEYAVVQCKRHSNAIGEPIVRDFFGAMQHEGADVGYIITTSHYTKAALSWAKGKRMVLIDGNSLLKMLDETNNFSQHANWRDAR